MNHTKRILIALSLLIGIIIVVNTALWIHVKQMNSQIVEIQQQMEENNIANTKVLDMLVNIQKQQQQIESQLKTIKAHDDNVSNLKQTRFTLDSDLSATSSEAQGLTSEDMNKIINYWVYHMGVSNEFINKGDAFIKAAKESGLNPIYILAHAAWESGWGSSYLARTKHNYFGINAIDEDPGQSYHMGSSTTEGIVSGADWIKKNFYAQGYTSLSRMRAGGYATDPSWGTNILNIMNTSLKAL